MPTSDLSILKTVNNSTPNIGSNITFTISVFNNGPDDDTGVVVTDVLPSGYSIVSATPTRGVWVSPTWTIGNFLTGASATLIIVVTVLPTGIYNNTSTITGVNTDPDPSNNTSTVNVIVNQPPPPKKRSSGVGGLSSLPGVICMADNGNMPHRYPHYGVIYLKTGKDANGNICYARTNQRG